MTANWRDILVAYLHDPPDKALQIRGHESRARSYLQAALGDSVSEAELKDPSDPLAAIAERVPAPNWQTLTVPCEQGRFLVRHPLSAAEQTVTLSAWNQQAVSATIARVVATTEDTERRFLLLWRLLAEQLAHEHGDWFEQLPADTRIPDHTIWQHLDTTAALKGAQAAGGSDAAFLSFSLGPVQSFIAAARSLRDLWSGSMILAWLTFQGMLPVIEAHGPTALVYPALRGLPWLDLWLRDEKDLAAIEAPPKERRIAPCIPNRFLAVVPWGPDGSVAGELAARCRSRARAAWLELADAVRNQLDRKWKPLDANWAARWAEQVQDYFEIQTCVLPWRASGGDQAIGELLAGQGGFAAAFPDAAAVRSLADAIPPQQQPGYAQKSAGSWQAKVELSARLMQAQRAVRHVPPSTVLTTDAEQVPPKCSLLGSYEQMGPAGLQESADFWSQAATQGIDGVRLRERERLSAVALVKRFSGPCFFRRRLQLESEDLRYEDTASVAARCWLEKQERPTLQEYARRYHGSQWLYWSSPTQGLEEDDDPIPEDVWRELLEARRRERPPAYYAVLMLDGDDMGRWLRGEKSPQVREVLHPQLRQYFADLPAAAAGLQARRPVGPALHAAISEALANFALHFVPAIVDKHAGTLIYAGGDDVLALLPTRTALACASELSRTFRANWLWDEAANCTRLLMGERATVSAGLAIVHYKEDLRFALEQARKAERAAKTAGRDALQITACRRSGEHATALCPWAFVDEVERWVGAFAQQASDRWAYHLRAEMETLQALPMAAMQAELSRQIGRSEDATRRLFGAGDAQAAGPRMVAALEAYRQAMRPAADDRQPAERRFTDSQAFSQFITLCQSASFLARGRDE